MRKTFVIYSLLFVFTFITSCNSTDDSKELPICSIVSPMENEEFEVGAVVSISIDAYSNIGTIVVVDLFINDELKAKLNGEKHRFDWDTEELLAGQYTIKAVAKDNHGSTATAEKNVVLIGVLPEVSFNVDRTIVKKGNVVKFKDRSTNSPKQWFWDFGDGDFSEEQHPEKIYNEVGVYSIKLVVSNEYGSDELTKDSFLEVGMAPIASFKSNFNNIKVDDSVELVDHSLNEPTIWRWDFGDGNFSSDANPTHKYNRQGTFDVTLEVRNKFGSDTKVETKYITVEVDEGKLVDIDGNEYKTVRIGTQTWMAENLKVTHFTDGNDIRLVTDDSDWGDLEISNSPVAYCYYDNNTNSGYGALYTYTAAINACPEGWHLPSDDEWKKLEMHLGMSQEEADATHWRGTDEGKKMKSIRYGGTDDYGFSALMGGFRKAGDGVFGGVGERGMWWTSTEDTIDTKAYKHELSIFEDNIWRSSSSKLHGYNVRCLKD